MIHLSFKIYNVINIVSTDFQFFDLLALVVLFAYIPGPAQSAGILRLCAALF